MFGFFFDYFLLFLPKVGWQHEAKLLFALANLPPDDALNLANSVNSGCISMSKQQAGLSKRWNSRRQCLLVVMVMVR